MQRAFVENYYPDENATKAAAAAGYKEPRVQGCQNLTKLNIQNALAAQRQKYAEAAGKDKKTLEPVEVLEFLSGVIKAEVTSKKPVISKFGKVVVEAEPTIKERIAAADLYARLIGMMESKVSIKAEAVNPYDGLTTEQLARLSDYADRQDGN